MFQAIAEQQVKTGGYEAEYGRVLGGTINVVTKSGGNEFHGDAFGYYDGSSLAASDKRTTERAAAHAARDEGSCLGDVGSVAAPPSTTRSAGSHWASTRIRSGLEIGLVM